LTNLGTLQKKYDARDERRLLESYTTNQSGC